MIYLVPISAEISVFAPKCSLPFAPKNNNWKTTLQMLATCVFSKVIVWRENNQQRLINMINEKNKKNQEGFLKEVQRITISIPPYTGDSTPPSPEIPKSLTKVSKGPPSPECQESFERVPEHWSFHTFLAPFRVLWDFFDTFLTLRPGGPFETFLRLFGAFGLEGLGTPACGGWKKCKTTKKAICQRRTFGKLFVILNVLFYVVDGGFAQGFLPCLRLFVQTN